MAWKHKVKWKTGFFSVTLILNLLCLDVAGSSPKSTAERAVTTDLVRYSDGLYHVAGFFDIQASKTSVWAVLTDYSHIADFVPSVKKSEVLKREKTKIFFHQIFQGKFLFFSKRAEVILEVHERPWETIRFGDVLKRDFETYVGLWRLEEKKDALRVFYGLEVRPKFAVPAFIQEKKLKDAVRELLESVFLEMARREKMTLK